MTTTDNVQPNYMGQLAALEIAQQACSRIAGIDVPSSLFKQEPYEEPVIENGRETGVLLKHRTVIAGNTERLILTAIADTVREIMSKSGAIGLSSFRAQWAFVAKEGTYAYMLPPDWYRGVDNTMHALGEFVNPPQGLSPSEWIRQISRATIAPSGFTYVIENNLLKLDPMPTKDTVMLMTYLSKFPVVATLTDDDLESVDEYYQPKHGLVPRDGQVDSDVYQTMRSKTEPILGTMQLSNTVLSEQPATGLYKPDNIPATKLKRLPHRGSDSITNTEMPAIAVRKASIEADTDWLALTDTHAVSLGVTAKVMQYLGIDARMAVMNYEKELESLIDRDSPALAPIPIGQPASPYDEDIELVNVFAGGHNYIVQRERRY